MGAKFCKHTYFANQLRTRVSHTSGAVPDPPGPPQPAEEQAAEQLQLLSTDSNAASSEPAAAQASVVGQQAPVLQDTHGNVQRSPSKRRRCSSNQPCAGKENSASAALAARGKAKEAACKTSERRATKQTAGSAQLAAAKAAAQQQ